MTYAPRFLTSASGLLLLAALAGCGDAAETAGDPDVTRQTPGIEAGADTSQAARPADGERLVDPNDADADELLDLPGMDSAAVAVILEQRPFEDMLALHSALGSRMDSAALDGLYRELFIPIDLNSAPREEILLIPGVGERMAGEFLEYRPYRAMAEFRQEIGKYVDEDEVARLERYVFIR